MFAHTGPELSGVWRGARSGGPAVQQLSELKSELGSNKAVDDEVDAGVGNYRHVRHVVHHAEGPAVFKVFSNFPAVDYIFNIDPFVRSVDQIGKLENKECNNYTEQY